MPNLSEYFNNDFKIGLVVDTVVSFTANPNNQYAKLIIQEKIEVKQRIHIDQYTSNQLFTYYIPESLHTFSIICAIINDFVEQAKGRSFSVSMISGYPNQVQVGNHVNSYSNRIYFYTETLLQKEEVQQLDFLCKIRNLFIIIRSSDYIKERMKIERPVAFISHDSRDKELIARPLATGLNSRLCYVWYDEYSLKVGDSLRESIEKGIKEAKKCILILTKNYLNNPGWGKKEFDSIFTREMIMNERIVLPIWYNVSKHDIYNFSPSLAETFALTWPSKKRKLKNSISKRLNS